MLSSWRHPDGSLCVFEAAVSEDMERLESLLGLLNQSWAELGFDVTALAQRDKPLIAEILGLSRTVGVLTWDVEQICNHPESLAGLLLGQENQFWQAHQFESVRPPAKQYVEGEPFTAEFLPFPTSGNARADQIGALLAAGWKPRDVKTLLGWLSAEQVDKVLHVNNEILRADERVAEFISGRYEVWKKDQEQARVEAAVKAAQEAGKDIDPSKIKAVPWFDEDEWE
jgi:hypothetical protein